MRAVINGDIDRPPTDVDSILNTFAQFFYIQVVNQNVKDWLEGYALVLGVQAHVLRLDEPIPNPRRGVLTVTFPELDL